MKEIRFKKWLVISFMVVLVGVLATMGLGWSTTGIDLKSSVAQLESTLSNLESVTDELSETHTYLDSAKLELGGLKEQVKGLESYSRELESNNTALLKDSEALKRMQSGFSTRGELVEWLRYHHNTTKYNGYTYNCEDFAKQLSSWAREDGYYLGLLDVPVPTTWYLISHARNFAIIGDEIYEIEPQTNEISYLQSAESETSETLAIAAVWKYLLGFVKDDKGREFYDLLRNSVCTEYATAHGDQYNVVIYIFVDYQGIGYPSLATASVASTNRLVAWFEYLVYSDGTAQDAHSLTGFWWGGKYYEPILNFYETTLSGKDW